MLKKTFLSFFVICIPKIMGLMDGYCSIFMNSSSVTIILMEEFHDFAMLYLTIIMAFLSIMIIRILSCKFTNYKFSENVSLELIWTMLPMGILFLIAYPSIYYLYLFDLALNPTYSTKVMGAQWYWIYENFDSDKGENYSSYMMPDTELISSPHYKFGWRLLETDTRMVVPYGTEVQCLTTSMDVIHSFSIPELGIKADAIPGRLNSITFQVTKPGVFYGQCAEICGTGHPFMPICMEAI